MEDGGWRIEDCQEPLRRRRGLTCVSSPSILQAVSARQPPAASQPAGTPKHDLVDEQPR